MSINYPIKGKKIFISKDIQAVDMTLSLEQWRICNVQRNWEGRS